MKVLFALTIALFFSLASPAFCQNGPDIFPDEHTRKLARELDLRIVKEVYISASYNAQDRDLTITDPKVIALLVEGLKTVNTTNFSNKVDGLEVLDKNDRTLISYRFSLRHLPELSPEIIKGLKAAGVAPSLWKEMEEAEKAERKQRETLRQVLIFTIPLAIVSFLAYFIFRRKTAMG